MTARRGARPSSPLRLLFVDDSGRRGGGQLALERYLRAHSAYQRAVIFVESGPVAESVSQLDHVRCTVLGAPTTRLRRYLRAARVLVAVRRHRPDVVVANSLRAAIQLSFIPTPGCIRVIYVRELMSREWLGPVKHLFFRLWVLRRFSAVLANSAWTASTLPIGRRRVPVKVVYTISGLDSANPSSFQERGHPPQPLTVLYLGRVARWKGITTLTDAVQILKARCKQAEIQVTVAGDASFGDQDLWADLLDHPLVTDGTLHLAGFVDDPTELIRRSDLTFIGSIIPEPFGQVVVQSLALGTPVVVSRTGGPAEILGESGAGAFFRPGDADDLADVLEGLMNNREQLKAMSGSAAVAVERFLDDRMINTFEEAIGEFGSTLSRASATGPWFRGQQNETRGSS